MGEAKRKGEAAEASAEWERSRQRQRLDEETGLMDLFAACALLGSAARGAFPDADKAYDSAARAIEARRRAMNYGPEIQ